MFEQAKENAKELPGDRIDVTFESDEAVIRLSTFVEGLGWCSQKTIKLRAENIEALFEQISVVREQICNENEAVQTPGSNVIAFPCR